MKDWYLIGNNTKPNMIGGYEDEGFLDCKDDTLSEALDSEIGTTVTLYNYDLSISKEIRAIIQGNLANTQLKSMERTIITPIGTIKSGDYIFFENEYWIVDGRTGNNKVYEKSTLKECQYKLRWQKNNGDIIERWANLVSASKYDVGRNQNNVFILTSNNYTIIIPNDSDSQTIDGKRVFIDLADVPEKVFEITRNDDVLFNHPNNGGTLSLIADKTELNKDTDNQELRICDYIQSTTLPPQNDDDNSNVVVDISGKREIMNGFSRTYSAELFDQNGIIVEWDDSKYKWNIKCDFKNQIKQEIVKNKIKLSINNEDLVGYDFILEVIDSNDKSVIGGIEVTICEL